MYEAKQNKEKVSRRIDGGGMRQRMKLGNKKYNMSPYTNNRNIINKKKSYVKNIAFQRNFDELGSNAMFISDKQSEVGSIYFRNGRLRLIHDHGPAINIHKNKKRYIITGNFSLFSRMFKDARKRGIVTDLLSTVKFMVDGCQGWSAVLVGNQTQNTSGRLFEVFFDNNNGLSGTHTSRGGVNTIPNALSQNVQMELYYIIKYSKIIAEKIYNAIINQIGLVTVTKYISDRYIMAKARVRAEPTNNDARAEKTSLLSIKETIKKTIIPNLQIALLALNRDRKRMIGYIGNMILRNSFWLNRVGLNVRDNN